MIFRNTKYVRINPNFTSLYYFSRCEQRHRLSRTVSSDAIDRASSFSRENTQLVGRGRTYARCGAKEEAGEGIAIGRGVGIRWWEHATLRRPVSTRSTVKPVSSRDTFLPLSVFVIFRVRSRVRVYISLFLTLFFRSGDEVIQFQRACRILP